MLTDGGDLRCPVTIQRSLMITLNKWAGACLERLRSIFSIKDYNSLQNYSLALSREWRSVDEGVKNLNSANMVIEQNRWRWILLEHLADMVIFCIGMMRHLGEEDVEAVIRKRLGR